MKLYIDALNQKATSAAYRIKAYLHDHHPLPYANDALDNKSNATLHATTHEPTDDAKHAALRDALRASIWLTYRHNFAPIAGSSFTSDAGWGCMMRSGQMIVAEAMRRLGAPDEAALLALFADEPEAPLGIHAIVLEAAAKGTPVGRWLGPASIAQVLATLAARARPAAAAAVVPADGVASTAPRLPRVHVAMDGMVVASAVHAAAAWSSGESDDHDHDTTIEREALLLLVPLRLGVDEINMAFAPAIRALLQLDSSVGIIGGRPRSSYYFCGVQGSRLLFLDPHVSQSALSIAKMAQQLETCHCARGVRTLRMAEADPSLAFGFLLRGPDDLGRLRAQCESLKSDAALAPFAVVDALPNYAGIGATEGEMDDAGGDGGSDSDVVVV